MSYKRQLEQHEKVFGTQNTPLDALAKILAEISSGNEVLASIRDVIGSSREHSKDRKSKDHNFDQLMDEYTSHGMLVCKYSISRLGIGDGVKVVTTLGPEAIYTSELADCCSISIVHPNGRSLIHVSPGVMSDGQDGVSTGDYHDMRTVRNPNYHDALITAFYELAKNHSFDGANRSEEDIISMTHFLNSLPEEQRNLFQVVVTGSNDGFRSMLARTISQGGVLSNKDGKSRTIPSFPVYTPPDIEDQDWMNSASALLVSKKGIVSIRPTRREARVILDI